MSHVTDIWRAGISRRIHLSLLITLTFALGSDGYCQGGAEENANAISVITYNVQFLPGIAAAANKRKEPAYRAERIAEEMSRFDIVALQETFDDTYRAQIIEGLKKAWGGTIHTFESPKPADRFNGGCLILTRLPVLETNAVIYEHFSTPEEFGIRADGHAAKGVIHARIAQSETERDRFIDVYVTHLEARADDLRPLQYKEFAAFVKETADPSSPALFMGDFNTRGMVVYRNDPASQYAQLMAAFNEARPDGVVDVWSALMGDANGGTSEQESADIGRRIDYVFLANPGDAARSLEPKAIRVELYQDPKVAALSDHNAVVATFVWNGE